MRTEGRVSKGFQDKVTCCEWGVFRVLGTPWTKMWGYLFIPSFISYMRTVSVLVSTG